MADKKPIMEGPGEYVLDGNSRPIQFTKWQAMLYARSFAKRLSSQLNCQLSVKGIRDCGEYWTWTIG